MQQPLLKELRQMAINRVTQDMKHLDPCLASPFGRAILQHLPPDALATLLGSDALALLSENTTLSAIDVWLAGPVASSLAGSGLESGTAAADDDAGAADIEADAPDGGEGSGSSRLAAALQLLVRQVRLPLCSGAFLAAAVSQRPWLCLGLQGCHELPLMQQYYSSDSHGRYELAMQLLRSGRGCPWSVMLRRGLPATFSKASSTIYSAEHEAGSSSSNTSTITDPAGSKLGSSKGSGSGSVTNGVSDDGFGTYTGLSRMRSLLQWGPAGGSSGSSSAEDLQTLQQQGAAAAAAAAEGGILLEQKVLGGYVWKLSLVAVPWQDTNKASSNSSSSSALPPAAAAAAAALSGV
ncbi:hypothetical protein OEZ85_011675 [Tetradesmus obliquus]|uniref:BACK domain-containing protein n=1 Tax=Tetradesmus obliquus TaxID=3088 RepID=A0ABY8TTC5_TETOB|nr:hypothetical protein OEZ85_011675 [Tetradesmus obliquus]